MQLCSLLPRLPPIEHLLSQFPCGDFGPYIITPGAHEFLEPDSPPEPLESSGTIIHGSWQPSEDDLLRSAVGKFGGNQWDTVASRVPGRTPTQCRERWMFRISPGLNKGPFERWEDELIIRERARVGNHWTLIADQLPGRTSCAVKNRWYSSLRRHARQSAAATLAHDSPPFSVTSLLSRPTIRSPPPSPQIA
jgi:hypothetical protein